MSQAAIDYTIRECSLGRLLVAASERGICHVRLGDCERALEEELRGELPFASFERSDIRLKEWSDVLIAQIDGGTDGSSKGHAGECAGASP